MSAGTIALTNNSATVTGTGTSFTTELKPGDFVYVTVGGAPYTLVASSVTSDTQLTLAVAFDGPTTTGLAWNGVPASLQVAITQKILNDFAQVARGRILDFQNWQKIYSSDQSVTVTRPDRTTFTGPSWGYMATQFGNKANTNDVLTKADNLNSLTDKPTARTNLGWVDGALPISLGGTGKKNIADAKSAMETSFTRNTQSWNNMESVINGILPNGGTASLRDNTANVTIYQYSTAFIARNSDTYAIVDVNHSDGNVLVAAWASGKSPNGNSLWGSKNTTVDSNGFIKRASPIVRVFSGDETPTDYLLSGFVRAGQCMANEEAEGVYAKRVSEGVYELSGCLGLSKEGWTIEIPQDANGYRQVYVQSEFSNGKLIIRTYHRINSDAPKFLQNVIADKDDGDAIDIPTGRWIDLRLSMPEDSAYNLRMQKSDMASASSEEAGS